jgi:phenylpropionate dioxygenase-like ring-hydroxylating dioxygenase large terminal subunit
VCVGGSQSDPDNPETAMQSKRACATSLPTIKAQGMLWVWPDTSEEGLQASKVGAACEWARVRRPPVFELA